MPKSKSFYFTRQQQAAKTHEFSQVSGFSFGYRNHEDSTTLSPQILVKGSVNVLTSPKGTVGNRKGYVLDGPANKDGHPVVSSYDWFTHIGTERNLRYTNNKLQYRYQTAAGVVTWRDLITLTGSVVNFAEFWDATELKSILLFVDGSSNIYSWSGGVGAISATTVNTITLSSGTWASTGFINTATSTVTINGHTYTYTGGAATATLTGVTPDPTGEANASIVNAGVVTTPNSAITGNGGVGTGVPLTFKNSLIATVKNQVYLAASDNFSVYISKENNYKDFSYASPRGISDGAILTLDAVPTDLISQDTDLYIPAGKDFWYRTVFTLSADLTKESLAVQRLKTGPLQAAQTRGLCCKIKNKIAFLSFEPSVSTLALDQNILSVPQLQTISSPILNDVSVMDYTGGHMKFFQNNLYVSAPAESLVQIYNETQEDVADNDAPRHYWEAPQQLPVGRFAVIGGALHGHSSTDGETFKLFEGWNDNGNRYKARAVFAYNSYGARNLRKSSDELFIEGYLSSNSTVTASLRRELGGSVATLPAIEGTNTALVGSIPDDASLGKEPLGKIPLGSSLATLDGVPEIPKFRVYLTYPRTPFFEEQPSFETDGVDQRFEIVTFSSNASPTTEKPTDIHL